MAKTMYQATGRRKSSVARVRLLPGAGNIIINKRDIDTYFGEKDIVKNEVRRPLELTGTLGSFDVIATVNGGGFTGQAGALRHGIARALCEVDEEAYRPALKAAESVKSRVSRRLEEQASSQSVKLVCSVCGSVSCTLLRCSHTSVCSAPRVLASSPQTKNTSLTDLEQNQKGVHYELLFSL